MNQTKILLIARDTDFYSDLKSLLSQDDILVCHVEGLCGGRLDSETDCPHLVVLDCPGTGVDGLAEGLEIRARYSGLLLLVSEHGDDRFHVLALGLGADASLPITAGAPLVAANIKALLRRFAPASSPSKLTFGELTIDAGKREVFTAGQALQFSSIEFQLFWYLSQKSGCVVTRDEISFELYHAAYNGYDRNIDLYL